MDFRENKMPRVISDFLSYMETIKGKSSSTVEEYFLDLRTFFRFLKQARGMVDSSVEFDKITLNGVDEQMLKSITLADLYDFLSFLARDRKNTAPSRARKVACLRSFFKYHHTKSHLITDNPAKELDSPKLKKSLPRYLSLDESIQLLDAVDGSDKERDYCILTLFLNCGMRLSELVGINVSDISHDKTTLRVIGKGNKERTIYLNRACIDALEAYLAVRPKDGVKDKNALFLSRQKKRISVRTVEWIVGKYLSKAGLAGKRYSPHKLRHTAATLMYKYGGVDVRALQEILGHEHLSTTEIYTHVDSEILRSAVQANPLAKYKNKGRKG